MYSERRILYKGLLSKVFIRNSGVREIPKRVFGCFGARQNKSEIQRMLSMKKIKISD